MRKGKDSAPDPYLWLKDHDPGRPKNMRILRIRFRIRIPNTGWRWTCKNFVLKFSFAGIIPVPSTHSWEKGREGPLTNGSESGSGRPKNMRILRIRIRNTACLAPTPTRKPGGTRPKGSRPFFCSSTSFRATTIGFRIPKKKPKILLHRGIK